MTNRENWFSIIKRTGYAYMPANFNLCPHLQETCGEKIKQMLEAGSMTMWPGVPVVEPPMTEQPASIFLPFLPDLKPGAEIDCYGVGHEPGSAAAMHMTHMRHPMESFDSMEQLMAYPYPSFCITDEVVEQARQKNLLKKQQDKILVGNMQCTIWEHSWYMRSMEQLMMDMMSEDPMAEYLLDRITGLAIQQAEFYAKTGADMIFLGDDIGMQKTIMMSETLYRTWLKPRLKRVVDAVRSINPQVVFFYHSCGYVKNFIPDLIDVGIDVLNPVQPECMDFAEIHAAFGDRISFHGTIGTQWMMSFGTPAEIRAEVFKNLRIAGEKGGLLVAPTHLLEPEVPWENIKAYIDACREFTL